MNRIKRVGVLSFGKVQALVTGIFGLFIGIIYLLLILFSKEEIASLGLNSTTGTMAVILFPVFYAVFGFIFGIFAGLVYNLVARLFGGIEIELENK